MKSILVVLMTLGIALSLYTLGAITHEKDIIRSCTIYGNSDESTWLAKLQCSPLK